MKDYRDGMKDYVKSRKLVCDSPLVWVTTNMFVQDNLKEILQKANEAGYSAPLLELSLRILKESAGS